MHTLRVKGGEAWVVANRDGVASQGSSATITIENLGTMRVNAERSKPTQVRTEPMS